MHIHTILYKARRILPAPDDHERRTHGNGSPAEHRHHGRQELPKPPLARLLHGPHPHFVHANHGQRHAYAQECPSFDVHAFGINRAQASTFCGKRTTSPDRTKHTSTRKPPSYHTSHAYNEPHHKTQ